jgi:hypothetical protein
LLAAESAGDEPTQAIFAAHFGLRGETTTLEEIGFSNAVLANNPHQASSDSKGRPKAHSLVKVVFRNGLWVRFCPAFSDHEVLDPREFDCSMIPYSSTPNDIGAWLRDFQSLWMKSGNCPNPGAYTVESSEWVSRLSVAGFVHFLIKGHDAYVEVLANDWKWEEVKKLPSWW